jgi:hypothetical protein
MARCHVLTAANGLTTVVFHIAVPAGNNAVGTPWPEVVVNSGIGGTTSLPSGDGTGGTIAAAELAQIEAGTVFEVQDRIPMPEGMTGAQANAHLDAHHAAKTTEAEGLFQERGRYFGYTRV